MGLLVEGGSAPMKRWYGEEQVAKRCRATTAAKPTPAAQHGSSGYACVLCCCSISDMVMLLRHTKLAVAQRAAAADDSTARATSSAIASSLNLHECWTWHRDGRGELHPHACCL